MYTAAPVDTAHAHKPFIPADQSIAELTPRALILGTILGILFGASSVYLALKVGMTVSASIPIAVLSITIFRLFGRATILENNIVQTTGSAGESIAAAATFTIPALLIMGYDMEISLVMLVGILGGVLGILMMIPMRKGLIVEEHGKLAYPEGTACAEVLIVGERGGTDAKMVFTGFGVGMLYKFLNVGARLWREVPSTTLSWFKGGSVAAEISPELLGVGYIIGPRVAGVMAAGGVLSFLVLIPAIQFFGGGLTEPLFPGLELIKDMDEMEVRNAYLLYIGAGAVAMGGIISVFRAIPTIVGSFQAGLKNIQMGAKTASDTLRTEHDLSPRVVILGSILLVVGLWLAPALRLNLVGALMLLVFGFIFVTVSSRITGEIGSSSNPISGMTVATLLMTCLIFVAVGWTGEGYRATALSVAAVVCVAASNGGTTSQDLKTGFIIGATPWRQQVAITVGALTSAIVVGYTLLFLNTSYTTYDARESATRIAAVEGAPSATSKGPDDRTYQVRYQRTPEGDLMPGKYLTDEDGTVHYFVNPGIAGTATEVDGHRVTKLDAPKARLMSLIIDGILTAKLPWALVLIGAFISLVLELCGVSSLPFAVGVYLPLSTSLSVFVGGMIRYASERATASSRTSIAETESSPGVLFSSGLIAGGALCGLLIAGLAAAQLTDVLDLSKSIGWLGEDNSFACLFFAALAATLYWVAIRPLNGGTPPGAPPSSPSSGAPASPSSGSPSPLPPAAPPDPEPPAAA